MGGRDDFNYSVRLPSADRRGGTFFFVHSFQQRKERTKKTPPKEGKVSLSLNISPSLWNPPPKSDFADCIYPQIKMNGIKNRSFFICNNAFRLLCPSAFGRQERGIFKGERMLRKIKMQLVVFLSRNPLHLERCFFGEANACICGLKRSESIFLGTAAKK